MNWKKQFKDEFGIHFSKSELQFAISFIEDLLDKQKQEFIKNSKELKELTELIRDLKFNH